MSDDEPPVEEPPALPVLPVEATTSPIEALTFAPCAVCGRDIPMRLSEYKEMIALGAPVMHAEHTAARDEPPALKSYRAVVHVFEMSSDGTEELVAATAAKGEAPTLFAAINGPLSEDLQRKWLAMADKSTLADLPSPINT